ncbi:class E sortase [Patescibacteria group bacterium]|nr:class E sortase [Patescibacteria group bacterium]MBU4512970.1 class E sortase [Patescibacteria group bacterium]MCG2693006.1 class E sortase [Candidatus Parcubacteria bacterium]
MGTLLGYHFLDNSYLDRQSLPGDALEQSIQSALVFEEIPDLEIEQEEPVLLSFPGNSEEKLSLPTQVTEANDKKELLNYQEPQPVATQLARIEPVNKIIIPKIGVDMKIIEGADANVLYQGAWHIPGTSAPDKGGNTVISAHRYLYQPPSSRTFYLLDKLGVGDIVKVIWRDKEYQYQVKEIKVVDPGQVEILSNTTQPVLTLFTCTPLFTSEKRLVVVADYISN